MSRQGQMWSDVLWSELGPSWVENWKHLEDAYGMPYFLGIPPRLKPIFGGVHEASVTSMRSSGFQMPNMIMWHQFRPVSEADAAGPLTNNSTVQAKFIDHFGTVIQRSQRLTSSTPLIVVFQKRGGLPSHVWWRLWGANIWDSNLGIQQWQVGLELGKPG